MTDIFSEHKYVSDQLSNAQSTMFLRRLFMFLHFDANAFERTQKALSCMTPIFQSGFLTQKFDFTRSNEASYEKFSNGFGTPKGHTFIL